MNTELARRVSCEAFEARYTQCDDPWQFAASPYERNRYASIMQALSRTYYDVAYEPGSSIGVLTLQLASLAKRVIATDIAPSAVKQTKARCNALSNVEVLCEDVAIYLPIVPLDLIIFSEIGYYFETGELARIASSLARKLKTRGEFVACHWLGNSEDHVLHGDLVHETLKSSLSLLWVKSERFDCFRIDCWVKP